MSRGYTDPRWSRDAPLRRSPPPDGVWAARASLWCGGRDCPRAIAEAGSERALERVLNGYRCPRCERPNQRRL